jgi:hypothetical protein
MRRWRCRARWLGLAFQLAAAAGAAAATYSGPGASGRVVDAQTGEPIRGAIVVASWNLTNRRHTEGEQVGVLLMTEAIANDHGEFSMPAWGPIEVPPAPHLRWLPRGLDYSEPHLHVYAPGYTYTVTAGPERGLGLLRGLDWFGDRDRKSWWNGKTIRIERSSALPTDYVKALDAQIVPLEDCGWAAVPHMAAAYLRETERIARTMPIAPKFTRAQLLHEDCPRPAATLGSLLE